MSLPGEAEIAAARRLVILVGSGYLLAQLVLLSFERVPSWDEAIYLSQVSPGVEPLLFAPHRARGITLLVAPVLQMGGSLEQVRTFLAVASAAALTASFRTWAPVIGMGAPAAALLFAGSWTTLFYGSEVMPNLWAAFPAVAASAVLARRLVSGERRYDELAAGVLVALMALVRPLDAAVFTAALVLLPVALRRGPLVWSANLVLGLAAGWAPWLVEMGGRFGGPVEALRSATRVVSAEGSSLTENIWQHLALADGPTIGPVPDPGVPVFGLLWLAGLAFLVVVGIRTGHRRGFLPAVVVPTGVGLAMIAEYTVFTGAPAPRFLIPAFALLAVPAGLALAGLVTVVGPRPRADRAPLVVPAATGILLIAWVFFQLSLAEEIEEGVIPHRESAQRAGLAVRRLAGDDPCQVYSETSYPMVGYASGCKTTPLARVSGMWREPARELQRDGIRVFVVFERRDGSAPPAGTAAVAAVPAEQGRMWFVYEVL